MSDLSTRLKALAAMSPNALHVEWRRVLRAPAPAISPDLLRRGIGYRLQEQSNGGLTTAASRELEGIQRRLRRGDTPLPASTVRLKPGTRLLRTWRDETYSVLVGDNGFIFADRLYPSLTPIAREITGTNWSGPRFFGLLSPKRESDVSGTADG